MLQADDMGIHGIVPWRSGTALDVGCVTAAALARQRHPLRRERRGARPAAPAPGRALDPRTRTVLGELLSHSDLIISRRAPGGSALAQALRQRRNRAPQR